MLVLTRNQGEEIIIGPSTEPVRVVIVTATGSVRIGIDAPPTVQVDRKEIWDDKIKNGVRSCTKE